MKEQKLLLSEYKKVDFTQRMAAVATVVKVRGSSYRSPGARMLITDDGRWVGSISGGCLEGDALRKARQVMTSKMPMTITYDTREESNQNLGIGLGCNGVIDVLIEPVDPGTPNNPVKMFEQLIASEAPVALATIYSNNNAYTGQKMMIDINGELLMSFTDRQLVEKVRPDLESVFRLRRSEARTYTLENETIDVFVELIPPNYSMIIFGGGFDARPVSELAKSLGWNVSVTDECVAHIAPIFFPTADQLSLCQRDFVDRDFKITPYTACVLMSHNYEYDRDVLKKLLNTDAPYIGILGPRKRFDKMQQEFKAQGLNITADQMDRIHSPIGLDIGAETPDEIALSIIAEVQTKFAGRGAGFLKYRNAPIHERDDSSDQVFKQFVISPPIKNKSANS